VHTCRAYKLGKRRWSYNQCELVLHQDDDCGPGNILAAVGAIYKKKNDLEELCTDPEGQVCELANAALPTAQLTLGMLAVNVHELVAKTYSQYTYHVFIEFGNQTMLTELSIAYRLCIRCSWRMVLS